MAALDHARRTPDQTSSVLPEGVVATRGSTGLRVELAPLGVRAGSRGLDSKAWRFGLGTLLFTFVTGAIAVRQLGMQQPNFINRGGIVLLAFMVACMWSMTAALALYAIELGKRRTIIGVVGGALLIERRGPYMTRRTSIAAGDLVSLAVELHYASLHRCALPCLLVRRRQGDALTLLLERPQSDLHWLCAELAPALALGAGPAESVRPGVEHAAGA